MIAQTYLYVYIYNAQRQNMWLWIIRHTYCIYMNMYVPWANGDIYMYICIYIYIMSAHAYMNICFWGVLFYWFVLSILSGLILFHNLALGYMLENVILFYIYIHFTWWWTSSHASSWVTHLTGMILVQYSRLLSDLFYSNCAWNCWRVYMFYCSACFYCTLSEMTKQRCSIIKRACYQIRQIAGWGCAGNGRKVFSTIEFIRYR